MSVMNSP